MAYKRQMRWEPGATLVACSICGFPFVFPGELVYADDKQFYCLRKCWKGKTVLADQREQAAAKSALGAEAPPLSGPKPSWR